jgi:hypothetical protein
MAMIDVTLESGVPAALDELLGGPAPAGNGRPQRVLGDRYRNTHGVYLKLMNLRGPDRRRARHEPV